MTALAPAASAWASWAGRASTSAETGPAETWACESGGTVLRQAIDGNTLYVGGAIGAAGRSRGKFLIVDPARGVPYPSQPSVAGRVLVIIPDGLGGWFIGGDIAAVGGLPRTGMAHVLADGAPDAWAPTVNGTVQCLTLHDGVLYVGGSFDQVDGEPRSNLAAFHIASHRLLPWRPDPNAAVRAICPVRDRLFFGGSFTSVADQGRSRVAAWDLSAGRLLPWAPEADGDVLCIEPTDSTVVLGGRFSTVSGVPRSLVAEVSQSGGALSPLAPAIRRDLFILGDGGARVTALLVRDSLLYFGGSFDHVGGLDRVSLACVRLTSGLPTDWDAHAKWYYPYELPLVRSFCVSEDQLYVAGLFSELGGRDFDLAQFDHVGIGVSLDLRSGRAMEWDPRVDHNIHAISFANGRIAIGGDFALAWDWERRAGIASFDLRTGALTAWDPKLNGLVYRLHTHDRTLYVGGDFTSAFGQPRHGLAAFDLDTGALKPWDPSPDMNVWAIDAEDSVVWVGGAFNIIGGVLHPYVAALDPETGAVLPWDPAPDDWVNAILHDKNGVYLGGLFTTLRGQHAQALAAVSRDSSAQVIWQAEVQLGVTVLARLDTTLYVGGFLQSIGGQPRVGLGAVDVRTGLPLSWRADLASYTPSDLQVLSIAPTPNAIYVGGAFTGIAGVSQGRLAALDPVSAQLLDWHPRIDPDRVVWDVLASDSTIHLGGGFTYVDTQPVGGFGRAPALGIPKPSPPLPGSRLSLLQNTPNPASERTAIRFSTPHVGVARVGLFDLQGRQLESREVLLTASGGEHEVVFRTAGLRPGCYLYRVQIGGETATGRMAVIH